MTARWLKWQEEKYASNELAYFCVSLLLLLVVSTGKNLSPCPWPEETFTTVTNRFMSGEEISWSFKIPSSSSTSFTTETSRPNRELPFWPSLKWKLEVGIWSTFGIRCQLMPPRGGGLLWLEIDCSGEETTYAIVDLFDYFRPHANYTSSGSQPGRLKKVLGVPPNSEFDVYLLVKCS